MRPQELQAFLRQIVVQQVSTALMIWGKPGIGKSSIVRAMAAEQGLEFIDVRLSQLMPSDLRGVPVPEGGITQWCPPAFLPQSGSGILFMDEINMAPPALQGVAQQLILDRQVGDYRVPEGWLIWAAGNQSEDRAAVYEMPAPLANRFLHVEAEVSLEDFKQYAFTKNLAPSVIGFLSFRPELIFKFDDKSRAWPSPRTWEMAATLIDAELPIDSAVGEAVAAEFEAYCRLADDIPDIPGILNAQSGIDFPADPSIAYATLASLVARIDNIEQAMNAFDWLTTSASAEWIQVFITDLLPQLREKDLFDKFSRIAVKNRKITKFLSDYMSLLK